jgi:nitrite reductase/ring-hydroxylating ferredoxin subunit
MSAIGLTAAGDASDPIDRWFPVARGEEVVARHIVQTQLLGREIAVWRDDAGVVNAWENRCPHRGVRLSIGLNTGTELHCRYHGWRYASGSGQCTYVPAHPGQKPAAAMRVGRFGAGEAHGFVWVNLIEPAEPPHLSALASAQATTLRSIYARAPAVTVAACLLRGYRFALDPTGADDSPTDAALVASDAYTIRASVHAVLREAVVTFLLQPVGASQSVIHGLLETTGETSGVDADRLAVLRHHNAQMTALRDAAEELC